MPDWAVNLISDDSNAGVPTAQASGFNPGGNFNSINNGGSSIEQTVNMEIRTSDPERAGQAALNGMQQQLQDARTNARRRGTGQ